MAGIKRQRGLIWIEIGHLLAKTALRVTFRGEYVS